ncbi:PREDICTED: uncharacterized protein LOC108377264 [Rhagoletis zephyria]|uniref:uncharacterized protein LOC108377264 n=1 Tax=Rhagoletis zephyria TaxID=28612 RepID=UPI000811509C|nr:PREDICTED: uncharacterized protein LOC108377264 [Rhagoletis zephyria]XP_036329419.1 uncharacterized protein LOC118741528 [Rhagoletis pomonella]
MRYISKGLTPEEAKKKVLDREKTSDSARGAGEISAPKGNPENKKVLDGEISPPEGKPEKKRRRLEAVAPKPKAGARKPGVTYASPTKRIRLAVLPKAFAESTVTREDEGKIEDAFVEEMGKGWRSILQSDGIHFRPGLILVDCLDAESAEWLRLTVPQLPDWEGAELTMCDGDNIPRVHVITPYLRKAGGVDTQKLLNLFIAQNEGMHTDLWKVYRSNDEKTGNLLTIGIDDRSLEAIKKKNCILRYRFGSVPVHVRKGREPKAKVTKPNTSPGVPGIPEEVAEMVAVESARSAVVEEVSLLPHEIEGIDDFDLGLMTICADDDSDRDTLTKP